MQIELRADIVCPCCALGRHRLHEALRRFPQAEQVRVRHRSFQLDPAAPMGFSEPAADMLRRRGMPADRIAAANLRIEQLARDDGLPEFHVTGNRVGSTSPAHELLAFASTRGAHERAWDLAFTAYFGERVPISTVDDLVALSGRLDLDVDEARDALESRRFQNAVAQDQLAAERLGVTGVPFFVIDRRYGVSGAQPIEHLLAAIDQAWSEHSPVA